jgi:hypothetical protein
MSTLTENDETMLTAQAQDAIYLGPAVVTALGCGNFTVAFAGEVQTAQPAFALAYQPIIGDVLLVIAHRRTTRAVYAMGVLVGHGTTSLTTAGDLAISAPGGRISLDAGSGVEITAPRVRVRSQIIELFATALIQRVQSALVSVAELFHITAGRKMEEVAGSAMEKAATRHLISDKETVINGSSIHLS